MSYTQGVLVPREAPTSPVRKWSAIYMDKFLCGVHTHIPGTEMCVCMFKVGGL